MLGIGARLTGAAAVAVTLLACAGARSDGWVEMNTEGTGPTIQIAGAVHRLDVEGGVWVIRGTDGSQYQPVNLPDAFRREALPVEAIARRRNDLVSVGMAGTLVDLLRIRERGAAPAGGRTVLAGTSWLLEDLDGAGVVDRIQATLTFGDDGSVSGTASCNQFRGTPTITGDAISFGPLAATRKGCPEAVMRQEQQYLEALRDANRFEIKGTSLYIHSAGRPQPLRFTAQDGA